MFGEAASPEMLSARRSYRVEVARRACLYLVFFKRRR
jgi:hypothetical protein